MRMKRGAAVSFMAGASARFLFDAPAAVWDEDETDASPDFSSITIDPRTPEDSWLYVEFYDGVTLDGTAKKQLSQAEIDGSGPWSLTLASDLANGSYVARFYTMDPTETDVTSHVWEVEDIVVNVSSGITPVGYILSTVPQAAVASYTLPLTGITAFGGGAAGDVQIGDTLILQYAETSAGDVAISVDNHASITWTEVTEQFGDDSNDNNHAVAIATVSGTPPATITVNGTANANNGNSAILRVYRGVNATIQDVAATVATGNNASITDGPAITPTTAGARVIALYSATQTNLDTGDFSGASPSGWGNVTTLRNTGGATRYLLMASFDQEWSSGALDPPSLNPGDSALSHSWTAITIALRPA